MTIVKRNILQKLLDWHRDVHLYLFSKYKWLSIYNWNSGRWAKKIKASYQNMFFLKIYIYQGTITKTTSHPILLGSINSLAQILGGKARSSQPFIRMAIWIYKKRMFQQTGGWQGRHIFWASLLHKEDLKPDEAHPGPWKLAKWFFPSCFVLHQLGTRMLWGKWRREGGRESVLCKLLWAPEGKMGSRFNKHWCCQNIHLVSLPRLHLFPTPWLGIHKWTLKQPRQGLIGAIQRQEMAA